MLALARGTIENVNITITDPTGELTTLDSASPTYSVIPVDPDTDLELDDYYLIYNAQSALNANMMIQALIDTTVGGTAGGIAPSILATNAVTLPLTVIAGTNDTFLYASTPVIISAGTYTSIASLITAIAEAAIIAGASVQASSDGNKLILESSHANTTDGGGSLNVGSNDILVDLGFNDNDLLSAGADPPAEWIRGKYNLYVGFTFGSEVPKLGPVELFIV